VGAVIPVLPVSVLATIFVREPDHGLDRMELMARGQALLAEFEASGAHVYIPRRDRDYTMEVGLRMLTLRHVVVERDGLLYARREDLPLLEYYANSVAHLLAEPVPAMAGAPTPPPARL
jgi:glycerol-3-phosphate O-acyltransferase